MAVATARHADAPAGCSPSARTARLLCRITAVRDAAREFGLDLPFLDAHC